MKDLDVVGRESDEREARGQALVGWPRVPAVRGIVGPAPAIDRPHRHGADGRGDDADERSETLPGVGASSASSSRAERSAAASVARAVTVASVVATTVSLGMSERERARREVGDRSHRLDHLGVEHVAGAGVDPHRAASRLIDA